MSLCGVSPKEGILLSAISIEIEFVDDKLLFPRRINLQPLGMGWDEKGRVNDMRVIDLLGEVFLDAGFRLVYYCGIKNKGFITEEEGEEEAKGALVLFLMSNPDAQIKVIKIL